MKTKLRIIYLCLVNIWHRWFAWYYRAKRPLDTDFQASLRVIRTIQDLIAKEFLEVDVRTPRIYLSNAAYQYWFKDYRSNIDSDRALAHLNAVRLYINFQRAYYRGLIDDQGNDEQRKLCTQKDNGFANLEDRDLIEFWVSGQSGDNVIIAGKFGTTGMSMWPVQSARG